MCKIIIHAQIVTPDGILPDGGLLIQDGKIVEVLDSKAAIPPDAEMIDAEGAIVGPGFVDIHNHGCNGHSTCDADAATVDYFLRHGTTTLLATPGRMLDLQGLVDAIENTRKAMQKSPVIKGIYMEGPYTNPHYGARADLNPWRHGVIEQECKTLVDAGGTTVKVWAIAPELANIEAFAAYAKQVNPDVVLAMGHSEANDAQIDALGAYRPTHMTHIMNATGRAATPKGTRGFGPDEYCLSTPSMTAELISDSCGIHVQPALQRMLLQIKGIDRIVLITDSTKVSEASPKHLAHISDLNFDHNGDLSGSRLTMDCACQNIRKHTGCSIVDAFTMASLNPAKVIGLDNKIGSIEKGKMADLVFVDESFNVLRVMLEGEFYE